MANALPRRVEVGTPVEPDNGSAGRADQLEHPAGAGGEMNYWNWRVKLAEQDAHVRLHVGTVVVRRQAAYPAVEDLNGLRARMNLSVKIDDEETDETLHECAPCAGVCIHELLGEREIARTPSLDQIRGQSERCPRKPDQRNLARQRSARLTHRFKHARQRLFGCELMQ